MGRLSDSMLKDDLFSPKESIAARNAGLSQVEGNNSEWMAGVINLIRTLPFSWTGTGEDIRILAIQSCGKPKHPNAWGAVINTAVRQRLLTKTGRRLKMKSVSSHARTTDEYRRL